MTHDPIMFWQAILVVAAFFGCIIYNMVSKPKK